MTDAEYLNLCKWCKAIHDQGKTIYDRQTQILQELSQMAADLSALQNAVAKIGTDVDGVIAAYQTAKANEADPAAIAKMAEDLTATSAKITAAVTPSGA